MNSWLLLACLWAFGGDSGRQDIIVVVGAPGNDEYQASFRLWASRWQLAADKGKARCQVIGLDGSETPTDLERLKQSLRAQEQMSAQPLWLVLIGHGTFDGKTARFNLRGPDFKPKDLSEWLSPFQRPIAVVNCASSSGPFLAELSAKNRVVITATKSGFEYNFARFGDFMSLAIAEPRADLDKDDQTSLLEAFLLASNQVKEFYDKEGRLATEHSLIDDTGDALGTPSDWFQGARASKVAKSGAAVDGLAAQRWFLIPGSQEQKLSSEAREKRDVLEATLAELRSKKSTMSPDDYYKLLEPVLVELSKLYN